MDERLRDLERAAATGSVEAEAKLLDGRAKAGELDADLLRLAADLGDPVAQAALGFNTSWTVGSSPLELIFALLHIARYHHQVMARAHAAVGRVIAPRYRKVYSSQIPLEVSVEGITASEEELEAEQQEYVESLDELEAWIVDWVQPPDGDWQGAVDRLCRAAFDQKEASEEDAERVEALMRTEQGPWQLPAGWEAALSLDEVQEAIRRELIPWALGRGDPVRERFFSSSSST